jgi:FMN phosphatase YigB (HAD superfamily)
MKLTNIKVIVFDLDGTLYENTHHFSYYAKRIEEKLSEDKREKFRSDYEAALSGRHPLKIGSVYDTQRDLILMLRDGVVKEAYRWDGTKLTANEVQKMYPNKITVNLDNMFSIGDLWWVPSSIGRHYGLRNEDTYQAFLETRKYMMSPQFQMKPIDGVAETLTEIRDDIKLVLMTNSPKPDSEAILKKLGLSNCFHQKIFEAGKPVKTAERFEWIARTYAVRFDEIMSVGDNLVNDIIPARNLGCKTIYIDSHKIGNEESADIVVEKLKNSLEILRNLANPFKQKKS